MGRTKHRPLTSNDCQDARNEALIAESRIAVSYRSDRRCRVAAGEWLTPYSNSVVADPSKLDSTTWCRCRTPTAAVPGNGQPTEGNATQTTWTIRNT